MTHREVERPPVLAETFVAGLVAAPMLRDAVLGDLAEEFSSVLAAADAATARRWYWRQAMGSVRPLVGSALAEGRLTLLAWGLAAYVAVGALLLGTNFVLSQVICALALHGQTGCVLFATLSLCGVGLWGGVIGSACCRGSGSAPVAGALGFCVAWIVIGVTWISAGIGSSPLWYRAALHLLPCTTTIVGGLRLAQQRLFELRP